MTPIHESEKKCCCEKCHGYYLEPKHEYFPLCNNKDCPCHSVPVEKEERCKFCSGKGYTMFKEDDCPKCWGTGKCTVSIPVEKPEYKWDMEDLKEKARAVNEADREAGVVPVENSWEYEFYEFFERFGANKIWVSPSRENVETIFEIQSFIRSAIKEAEERAYKEGLTENIEKLERTSEKYKTLFWCIRQDVIEPAVKAERKRIVEEVKKMRDEERYSSYGSGCIEDVLKLINR